MGDVGRHPNITVLANTNIESVDGEAGNYRIHLLRRPRYVDEELCVTCRTCAEYCPYIRPHPFDENLSTIKAIDVLSSQAIPSAAVIDRESCLYFQNKCAICLPVCQAEAIDFNQKRKRVMARVGAIILAAGYQTFNARNIRELGYGRMQNVITSLELERLSNADGPNHGEILRPSDEKVPEKIAWLQCVGSRDAVKGRSYCSSVCCTSAIKQLMLAKGHCPDTHIAVFHNDIRTFGKGFDELYERARRLDNVRFVRSRVPVIKENQENHNLILTYYSGTRIIEEEFEIVVLSVGFMPGEDNQSLADMMGLKLNRHGFFKTDSFSPNGNNSGAGIYPAGTLIGPMDIPDSICSAAGAVSMASQLLTGQRNTLSQPIVFPEERSVEGEKARVGVFICHCGTNIASVADINSLAEHASSLEDVVFQTDQLISCAPDSCRQITEMIKEKNLNRVVIAACSPRDHETVFRKTLQEGGLNPYLLEMANIREQCTWVHSYEKEEATQKSKGLISMAVSKARRLTPSMEVELPVVPKSLVIGGGLAGMKASLSLAGQGFEVFLIEKEEELGGNLRHIHHTLDGLAVQPFLKDLIEEVINSENIRVYTGHQVDTVSGYVGNYKTEIARMDSKQNHDSNVTLDHGTIIIATGGNSLKPIEYGYGENEKVVIQEEFEELIAIDSEVEKLDRIAIIQCVGARNEERPYCSRICCATALKNALRLKQINPEADIIVFYRDLRAYGFTEDYYAKARKEGIRFVHYSPEAPPSLELKQGKMRLVFQDLVLGLSLEFLPDLVVLSTPVVSNGNKELAQKLGLPRDTNGFFMEAHMKLRPLDFSVDGIFLCGMAHYPKSIPESISQAGGAAARAATILSKETVLSSGAVAEVSEVDCIGCGICEQVCPYSAISLQEIHGSKIANVIPAMCKGCGVCVSQCPTSTITQHYFTDRQISSQIEEAYTVPMKKDKPKVLAFLCHWCGYAGADLAGISRIQYAPNVRAVRVMCSGRIHPKFVYEAFLNDIEGVIIVGCHVEDCHYISGVQHTIKMIPSAQKELEKIGIAPQRILLEFCSAAEGARFAEIINGFTSLITDLDPLDLDEEQIDQLIKLKEKKAKSKETKGKEKKDQARELENTHSGTIIINGKP